MGSIQQSILGVFCIATAFLLGQYIRTHPSPEALEQQRQQQAAIAPAPSFAFSSEGLASQSKPVETSPRLPSPAAGFSATASGVSEPASPTAIDSAESIASHSRDSQVAAERPILSERKIDIPDFSQLAASFKNTPLALQETAASSTNRSLTDSTLAKPNTGSFYIRPAPERKPVDLSSHQTSFEQGQPAFAGSPPEPVAPPQPTESYQLRERPTSFRKEDFQPRLIAKESARRTVKPSVQPDLVNGGLHETDFEPPKSRRISLAPPEREASFMTPEIPDLEVTMPPESRPNSNQSATQLVGNNRAKNQLHSYYDVGMADSTNSVLDRKDFERSASTATAIPTTNRRIPFGLNAQGRQELTRIRSRQQTNIDLQTDRFSQHTTQAGDTLQSLSTKYYGKPDFYLDIYLANQQLLRNPAVIPAGIQLRIPRYSQ